MEHQKIKPSKGKLRFEHLKKTHSHRWWWFLWWRWHWVAFFNAVPAFCWGWWAADTFGPTTVVKQWHTHWHKHTLVNVAPMSRLAKHHCTVREMGSVLQNRKVHWVKTKRVCVQLYIVRSKAQSIAFELQLVFCDERSYPKHCGKSGPPDGALLLCQLGSPEKGLLVWEFTLVSSAFYINIYYTMQKAICMLPMCWISHVSQLQHVTVHPAYFAQHIAHCWQ